jgi:hypothetical protein
MRADAICEDLSVSGRSSPFCGDMSAQSGITASNQYAHDCACLLSQEQLRVINMPTIVSPQSLLGIHGVEMNCIGNKASYTLALDFAYSSEQLFTNVIG